MTKCCTRCKLEKSLEEFYLDRTNHSGRQSRCKDCAKATAKEWHENNPPDLERRREVLRRFRERNPGKDNEYGRKWREKDPERARELARVRGQKWRTQNPEGRVVSQMKRRTRAAAMTPEDHAYARLLRHDPCSYCGAPALPIDHIEPIWYGGAAGWENMTASCQYCNSSKRTDTLLSFLLRTASRS